MLEVEQINNNEVFEYEGPVRVKGSIGNNATVKIRDGKLKVDGNIGNDCEISLKPNNSGAQVIIGSNIFMSGISVVSGNAMGVVIKGSVGTRTTIDSDCDIEVSGDLADSVRIKSHNGSITAKNVGKCVILKTYNGDIKVHDVGENTSLKTHNGDIKANIMAKHTSATSHNGDVKVKSADKTAELDTHNGKVVENGVKRKKDQPAGISVSSMTIGNTCIFSSIGGNTSRVIVNGRDITELVNQQNSEAGTEQKDNPKPPVRYTKF